MPDKLIDIPGQGSIAFPDTMTDAEINAAATRLYKDANPEKKQPPVKTWTDTAVDWLPAVGGAVGGAVGAIPGAVLGATAGEAYKQLIQRVKGQRTDANPEASAASMVKAGIGYGAAPEAAGAVIGAGMKAVAPRLMQTALKPTLKTMSDMVKGAPVPRVVKTLLDEGVNVTESGVTKLKALLNATHSDVKAAIQGAEAAGAQIHPNAVASRLTETAKQFANQVNPGPDLNAVAEAGNQFLEAHGGQMLSPTQAQSLKQGTYSVLSKKYGQLGSAETEAQKALARGLKEELERAAPGIDVLNAKEADQLKALNALGRRVALTGNKDPIGFAWVTHNPMVFLTALIDRSPAVKSMLANGLYQSAGAAAKVSPDLIRTAVVALAQPETAGSE
jgi:hypothetical protein